MKQTYSLPLVRSLVVGIMLICASFVSANAKAASEKVAHSLAGQVWISPICAGAQREGDLCRKPLADIEVQMSDHEGHFVMSTRTDVNGAFMMSAPTGHYRLHVKGVGKITRCPDLAITLPTSKLAPVELECDSGMR